MATADFEMPPVLHDESANHDASDSIKHVKVNSSQEELAIARDGDTGAGQQNAGEEAEDGTRRGEQLRTGTRHESEVDTKQEEQHNFNAGGEDEDMKNAPGIPSPPVEPHAATHLPSPLPSPAQPDFSETPDPASSPPNDHPRSLGPINTTLSGILSLDTSSQGLISSAVSETDNDAPTSALESSTDALVPESQDTPKKELPRRQSSAGKTRDRSGTKSSDHSSVSVRRLSATKIQELTASPESLPVASFREQPLSAGVAETGSRAPMAAAQLAGPALPPYRGYDRIENSRSDTFGDTPSSRPLHSSSERPAFSIRTISTPAQHHRKSGSQPSGQAAPTSSRRNSFQPSSRPIPLNLESTSNFATPDPPGGHSSHGGETQSQPRHDLRDSRDARDPRAAPSPMPPSFPIPPLSAPTFLQLELAAQRPSPLYVYQSYGSDIPYESSAVKFERLKNFLLLPPLLERTLIIGALACLDAWLWTLTILPMRFLLAARVLIGWWGYVFAKEVRWLMGFVWEGLGRMWRRGRTGHDASRRPSMSSRRSSEVPSRSPSRVREPLKDLGTNGTPATGDLSRRPETTRAKSSSVNGLGMSGIGKPRSRTGPFHHRRTKSLPSNLSSFHKADLLQFAVIIVSSVILTQLDASRMYHFIRAQSAVKLYVIYNLVEVADRLLCALGQDIFECLFSSETLSRNSLGRSKVMLPLGMFCLALLYNCVHAITLFYQVITLNVAVNSYSNALLTLLMSNQFVEIKGSVFKRIEKENLFQLTCADVVERFQLWIVLLIIGMRNVVEVGGLSVPGAGIELGDSGTAKVPLHNPSILPSSFTILPSWLWSGEVLSPFVVVVASEMMVDWVKHAYINKFNNIKPNFYSRVLDILCKDYYTNAFVTPTLTRRLGLPLLPLSTLFIRASFQTYHMFLATHMPAPLPPSTQTSLSVESSTPTSPAVTAALDRLDHIIRHALGRSVYGFEGESNTTAPTGTFSWLPWTSDDVIAIMTLLMVIFLVWLVLLIVKLFLGMLLLRYSRDRYARMKIKEHAVATGKADKESFDAKNAKQVGGFGAIEVGDDRRRWIYSDDSEGLKRARDRERKMEEKKDKGGDGERDLSSVMRYEMVAKRIW